VKFNNADIYEVIHTLGRIAGINYLIDPRVRGVVNVQTTGSVKAEDALDLLFAILRVNGAVAIPEKGVYRIVPAAEAKNEALLPSGGAPGAPAAALPGGAVLKAVPLRYISAADMAKVIRPFLSAGGDATEVPRANVLLVTDTPANMEKHLRLVEIFDADAFRSAGVKLFPLKHVDPEEMAKGLESIFGALDFSTRGGRPGGINFVPLARLNSLLVVSASTAGMDEVERWVGELDREASGASRAVRLYRVRHGRARDVAAVLERLYPGKTAAAGKGTDFRPQVAEAPSRGAASPAAAPTSVAVAAAPPPASPAAPPKGGAPEKEGQGFDIILDEPNNALIIRGSASEYASLLDTLRNIDVYPRQILLEVLIGEVDLDDSLKLGIDWNYTGRSGDYTHSISNVTTVAPLTTGLKYLVEKTDRLTAAFRALANDGKVSILSAPSVIATNGKKARIDVTDSVPIVTATTNANSNPPVTTQSVEYRDVGVLLSFTPYINDEGLVTLEIEQEVSEIKSESFGSTNNPAFFKRGVNTTLVASRDRSIVLGGLVKERKERSRGGIPYLYKIPYLGWLFGARSDSVVRTELLVFITPRVVGSIEEGTRLSREFENRVDELKARMGETRGIRTVHPEEAAPPK
jgi:general secretion pathway protein D